MFSVICPTMWRSHALDIMIGRQKILDNPLIGELLLINNDPSKTRVLKHPKIRTIYSGPNIFVNPAWTYGVSQSKFDKICFLSDDTIFHTNIFEQINEYIIPDNGIFGIGPNCYIGEMGSILDKKIELTVALEPNIKYPRDYGMLMFFHKKAFCPIPITLKIFVGDLWIYAYNAMKRKVPNYYINNFDFITKASTTSRSPEFTQQNLIESQIVEGIFSDAFGPGIFNLK
jgi:hypothetical protein